MYSKKGNLEKKPGTGAFYCCLNLTDVHISPQTRIIPSHAFENCRIKTLDIPEGVKQVDKNAFANSLLDNDNGTLTIPSSLEAVGKNAFKGCNAGIVRISTGTQSSTATILSEFGINEFRNDPGNQLVLKLNAGGYVLEGIWLAMMREMVKTGYKQVKEEDLDPNLTARCPWLKASQVDDDISFESIQGMDGLKTAILERVILPTVKSSFFEDLRLPANTNIMLYGPPGTGKTMFVKALANEIKAPLFEIKCSDLLHHYAGETEKNVERIFNHARKHERAVIFFDEFDALGSKRNADRNNDFRNSVVSALLTNMQGLDTTVDPGKMKNSLVIIAATNRLDMIDSAFTRPGRFDQVFAVGPPGSEMKRRIVSAELDKLKSDRVKIPEREEIEYIVGEKTTGFSCADVVELIKRAKIKAVRQHFLDSKNDNDTINIKIAHFVESLNSMTASISKEEMEKFQKTVEERSLFDANSRD